MNDIDRPASRPWSILDTRQLIGPIFEVWKYIMPSSTDRRPRKQSHGTSNAALKCPIPVSSASLGDSPLRGPAGLPRLFSIVALASSSKASARSRV